MQMIIPLNDGVQNINGIQATNSDFLRGETQGEVLLFSIQKMKCLLMCQCVIITQSYCSDIGGITGLVLR